jgi:hypothetical protein
LIPKFVFERAANAYGLRNRTTSLATVVARIERVATGRAQERSMQVWIGFQRDEAYVHEWTGEVAEERDMGKAIGNAIGNAITAYMKSSGKPIWGTTILVDKA